MIANFDYKIYYKLTLITIKNNKKKFFRLVELGMIQQMVIVGLTMENLLLEM